MATVKVPVVNSPFAKPTSSGQILCIVCNASVKSAKVWTAHVNSRKHIETVKELKERKPKPTVAPPPPPSTVGASRLHPAVNGDDTVQRRTPIAPSKRKLSPPPEGSGGIAAKMPFHGRQGFSGHSDVPASPYVHSNPGAGGKDKDSPWQAETERKQKILAGSLPHAPNTTEALPEGFFDDPKLDRKIRNVPDPTEAMDAEFARFESEMKQLDQQQLEDALEDDEGEIVERELEDVDQQIAGWSRVNVLEKRKDTIGKIPVDHLLPGPPTAATTTAADAPAAMSDTGGVEEGMDTGDSTSDACHHQGSPSDMNDDDGDDLAESDSDVDPDDLLNWRNKHLAG